MNQNQKPHSREKKVGSGSANVRKGQRVNTGSRPAGGSGRPGGLSSYRPSSKPSHGTPTGGNFGGPAPRRSAGGGYPVRASGGFSLKKIVVLIVLAVIVLLVVKNCGGSLGGLSELTSSLSGGNDWGSSNTGSDYGTSYNDYSGAVLNRNVSPLARDKRVTPLGGGNDTFTVMVYMCGTDLESKYAMATKDLMEMTAANISDRVNIIVETGGCTKWQNNTVSSQKNQIYKVETGGLIKLEDNVGTSAMTDPANLTAFIDYCEKNYPANRRMLIFWDHGGGTVTGYGYDEKNPNASSMTLAKIHTALQDADCTFDVIGFDACLMATLETALVCNDYADYLLASEESEPGTGWYYTRWLNELSADPGKPTLDIAKTVIDDFVTSSTSSSSNAKVTLSLIDLAELEGTIPAALNDFASSTNDMIRSDGYQQVSNARAGVRQFAQSSRINQVDMVDLADRIGTKEAKALAEALRGCVKYNRSSISRCYGVSVYFPYENTKSVNSAVASYKALGIDSEYTKCIQSFASMELGGQSIGAVSQNQSYASSSSVSGDLLSSVLSGFGGGSGSSSASSPLGSLMGAFLSGGTPSAGASVGVEDVVSLLGMFSGRSMPADLEWADKELIASKAEQFAANYLDPGRVQVTDRNGTPVLRLTPAEWKLVQSAELNVFVDDGEGYIDLGRDNVAEFDGDDMLLTFDGTWLTVNGNVCAYYMVSDTEQEDGSYVTVGRIPALLNGEYVNLQVVFDAENPYGVVTGAYPAYEGDAVSVEAKGCVPVKAGDTLQMLCDYYGYDGTFDETYTLGDAFKVKDDTLELVNLALNADGFSVSYRLTDIYGNYFWTPAVEQ